MINSLEEFKIKCVNPKTEQGIDRVLGELARCDNQFVEDIKEYLL